jgi:predicted amidohydrolase YtcJ
MSIQKKSVVSSQNPSKKTIVAGAPAADASDAPVAKTGVKLTQRNAFARRLSKRLAGRTGGVS